MADLETLKAAILADGKVDAKEVAELQTVLLADGIIDREEADFLFTINDAVSSADNDPSWAVLFSKLIAAHVLEDDTTPGVISEEEAVYLKERIDKDGTVDAAERALLGELKRKAQGQVPASLQGLFDTYL